MAQATSPRSQQAPCPVVPSARPCLTPTAGGALRADPDRTECYRTGQWCQEAAVLAPAGSRPSIPARFQNRVEAQAQGLPPHDIDAEEAVLGSLLLDSDLLPDVRGILKVSDFYREINGWVYQAIIDQGQGIDQVTVAHHLENNGRMEDVGGAAYLSYLVSCVPTPFHGVYYARVVLEMAQRRLQIHRAGQIAAAAYQGAGMGRSPIDYESE